MKFNLITMSVLILFFMIAVDLQGQVKELTFACEDQEDFPNVLGSSEKINPDKPGVAIEVLRLVEKKLNVKINIKRGPWKRILEIDLKTGVVDGVFTASYKPERDAFGAFPKKDGKIDETRRFASVTYSFYKLKNSQVNWDGTTLKNFTASIDAPRGYSIVDDLKKKGYNVEESASTNLGFKKLIANRVSLVAALETTGDHFLSKTSEFNSKIEKVNPPIISKAYYFMLSNQLAQKDPVFAEKFWNAIKEIREKEFKIIIEKYLSE